jgi:hypothetical protein
MIFDPNNIMDYAISGAVAVVATCVAIASVAFTVKLCLTLFE